MADQRRKISFLHNSLSPSIYVQPMHSPNSKHVTSTGGVKDRLSLLPPSGSGKMSLLPANSGKVSLAPPANSGKVSLVPPRMSLAPPASSGNRLSLSRSPTTTDTLRNNKDKQMMNESIRQLWDFLVTNEYPHRLSIEQLKTIQFKDFSSIFEFMFRFLDTNFTLSHNNAGTEISTILKTLGYPHTINKSILSNSAPHNAHYLLNALNWLRELIYHDTYIKSNLEPSQCLGRKTPHPDFTQYVIQSYKHFLATGDPKSDELYNRVTDVYHSATFKEQNEIVEIERTREHLKREILVNEEKTVGRLKIELDALVDENKKMEKVLEMHKDSLGMLEKKIIQKKETIEFLKEEIKEEQLLKQSQITLLHQQQASNISNEKFHHEHNNLKELISLLQETNTKLNDEVNSQEIAISKLNDQCLKNIREYHSYLRSLKLFPPTEKYSKLLSSFLKNSPTNDATVSTDSADPLSPLDNPKPTPTTNTGIDLSLKLTDHHLQKTSSDLNIEEVLETFINLLRQKQYEVWSCTQSEQKSIESFKNALIVEEREVKLMEEEERALLRVKSDNRRKGQERLHLKREQLNSLKKLLEEKTGLEEEEQMWKKFVDCIKLEYQLTEEYYKTELLNLKKRTIAHLNSVKQVQEEAHKQLISLKQATDIGCLDAVSQSF